MEDGHGLDIQETAIRTWVKDRRYRLLDVFRDEGVSASQEQRDGLEEALSAVRFNGADGMVVSSLDRLARSLTLQEASLQQVWASGGSVFAVDTGEVKADDPDDPVRTFVRQILGAVSQLEAGMITRRLRRGREHKAQLGGYAHGAPPYGFRADAGRLVPDPEEQRIVLKMIEMRDTGSSLRDIAADLNDAGVSAKRGGIWHPQTVARVLQATDGHQVVY